MRWLSSPPATGERAAPRGGRQRCPACGRANRTAAKFCTGCGAKLPWCCPHCGAAGELGDRYCAECGNTLGLDETEPAGPLQFPNAQAQPEGERAPGVLRTVLADWRAEQAALGWSGEQIAAFGGLAAVVLAALAETLIEAQRGAAVGFPLYLIAILVFAVSGAYVAATPSELPIPFERAARSARPRRGLVLGGGVVIAVALNGAALLQVHRDLGSPPGVVLWLLSTAVLLGAGVAAGGGFGWPARWAGSGWPAARRQRALFVAVVAAILLLAALARLLWLDRLPYGLIPDEGDRAATSMQILRGTNTRAIFDTGWYFISMIYYWLLAQVLHILGIGYAQARVSSAVAGILTVGVVTAIGVRHFSVRVGLLAGALLSLLGVALQFSRLTNEATPTALLWAISALCFLEAARSGKPWAWIGAGLAGGFSIYFYPSAKLWAVMAAAYCVYLFLHGLGGRRRAILGGALLAGLASVVIADPFLLNGLAHPQILFGRADEVSIFTRDNVQRLAYYDPHWTRFHLVLVQIARAMGLFSNIPSIDIWPTGKPLMTGLLAVLTMLGLGWSSVKWRDPRHVLLALWFWLGFVGVIVTVETPDVLRMGAAVPVLALFPALVLDSLARRFVALASLDWPDWRRRLRWGATAAAALVIGAFMLNQGKFYFVDYAKTEHWLYTTTEGTAVRDAGPRTLVATLGQSAFMVNSGWIRLLAPRTPRGGVDAPGDLLPLTIPADTNLSFMVYPTQNYYLPYLASVYPGGVTKPYTEPADGLVVTLYGLTQAQWRLTQGAMVTPPTGAPRPAPTLGAAPAGWSAYPASMRWTAGLRVPRTWNYRVQVGPGPARLLIDGKVVLEVGAGQPAQTVDLNLVRGDHAVELDGVLSGPTAAPLFAWGAWPDAFSAPPTPGQVLLRPARTEELIADETAPHGLAAVIQLAGQPVQRRLDSTIADCCLSNRVQANGRPYTATWTGTLTAPTAGAYTMQLNQAGAVDLVIDGQTVVHTDGAASQPAMGKVALTAGPHTVQLTYRVANSGGLLEWVWTPPGASASIVPPAALTPPAAGLVGPPLDAAALGSAQAQPADPPPLDTIR